LYNLHKIKIEFSVVTEILGGEQRRLQITPIINPLIAQFG